jgi:hypothetical protein
MSDETNISTLYHEFTDALTEVLAENAVGAARRGRLARARTVIKRHPAHSEHEYFVAVETAFLQWEVRTLVAGNGYRTKPTPLVGLANDAGRRTEILLSCHPHNSFPRSILRLGIGARFGRTPLGSGAKWSQFVLMAVETIGEAFSLGWRVTVRCSHSREDARIQSLAVNARTARSWTWRRWHRTALR